MVPRLNWPEALVLPRFVARHLKFDFDSGG
jgi:hypothetical protein